MLRMGTFMSLVRMLKGAVRCGVLTLDFVLRVLRFANAGPGRAGGESARSIRLPLLVRRTSSLAFDIGVGGEVAGKECNSWTQISREVQKFDGHTGEAVWE